MLRDFNARIRKVAIAVVAAAVCIMPLFACGVKGPLKLPPPAGAAAAAGAGASTPDAQSAPTPETPATSAPKPPDTRP